MVGGGRWRELGAQCWHTPSVDIEVSKSCLSGEGEVRGLRCTNLHHFHAQKETTWQGNVLRRGGYWGWGGGRAWPPRQARLDTARRGATSLRTHICTSYVYCSPDPTQVRLTFFTTTTTGFFLSSSLRLTTITCRGCQPAGRALSWDKEHVGWEEGARA